MLTKPTTMEFEYHADFDIPVGVLVFFFLFFIFLLAAMWRVFAKAGQPGWASIIPIYNIYVMTKIGGKPGYWTLLCLIPGLNIIFSIWLLNMISKSFGKDEGFTAGLIFLGIIFWPVLGFGSAKYLGPYGDPTKFAAYQEAHKFDFEQPRD